MLGQDEARNMKHNYIGTEHILLGLLRCPDPDSPTVANLVLGECGIDVDATRMEILRTVGEGDGTVTGHLPFTPKAKKALELALRDALSLGHNYIGTEHVLLGLLRDEGSVASRVLLAQDCGDLDTIRQAVLDKVSTPKIPRAAVTEPSYEVQARARRKREEELWKKGFDAGWEARGMLKESG